MESGGYFVFYDGVCGLCHRSTKFILPRDKKGQFRFAPLQSELCKEVFARHGRPHNLDGFALVTDFGGAGERIDDKTEGALRILEGLGRGWWLLAKIGRVLPQSLCNVVYRLVADNRYKIMGKADACILPAPEHRQRFVALDYGTGREVA